jgi:SAM-dependent methyltransferase
MPVENETIDVILSNCVINLCEDKGRVFEEAYRVLRAGGRLAISDMVTAGPLPMSVRGDAERWAGCVHGALPEGEYLDLIRAAGFTDVRASRSLSGGAIDGVAIYSVSVSAYKGGPADGNDTAEGAEDAETHGSLSAPSVFSAVNTGAARLAGGACDCSASGCG